MSLEKIEQHIKELEAIKYYDEVKRERDEALWKVGALENTKMELEKNVESLTNKVTTIETERSKAKVSAKNLEVEIEKLRSTNIELEKRVAELEQIKVGSEGKTIKEVVEAYLKAEKEEIKKEAEKGSYEIHSEWEKNQKPKEVFETSVRELRRILSSFKGIRYVPVPLGSAQPKLPAQPELDQEVNKVLNEEVYRRLDEEFNKRVEIRSNEIALIKFEEWKKLELKKWHDEKVMPEIARLDTSFRTNITAFLRDSDFMIICNKCGKQFPTKFTGEMVSELLIKGKFNLLCMDPNCKDFVIRHQIPITLKDIVDHMIAFKTGYS